MHMGLDGALVCIWVSRTSFIIIPFWTTPDQQHTALCMPCHHLDGHDDTCNNNITFIVGLYYVSSFSHLLNFCYVVPTTFHLVAALW